MDKRFVKAIVILLAILLISGGVFILHQILAPEVIYQNQIESIKTELEQKIEVDDEVITENRIMIPSIGVDVEIGSDYSILDTGGWVQEETADKPTLIAIHRFGLDTLSPQEKIRTTLYHVYKLNKGDKVIVWWNGQEYIYEIQKVYEDTKKPEVKEGELYLYTCLFWDSEERVFVKLT